MKKESGPDPEVLKIDKHWEDAMKDALKKQRPGGGWPDRVVKKRKPGRKERDETKPTGKAKRK